MPQAIGVDVGGTKVAAGVVDDTGQILAWAQRATPFHDPRAIEKTIVDLVAELRAGHEVSAVGIGAAGFVDAERATVVFAPHLAWRDEPLRDAVAASVGLPVIVENDANAAAWAEWRFGAGVGQDYLVCVTLGTGIGGGIVMDGRLRRGRYGMAGEFGHMVIVPDGHLCECGNRGCLEQYASGNALSRTVRELARAGSPVVAPLVDRVGGDIEALNGQVVTAAARDGDPWAVELVDDVGRWLGIGLANLAAVLDPGVLVIGGGVSEAGELLLRPVRESFRRTLTGRGLRPEARIVAARLGVRAGLVGAADLARQVGAEIPAAGAPAVGPGSPAVS
jgi:glucokinase